MTPFDFTYVQYDATSPFGVWFAAVTFLPVLLPFAIFVAFFSTRELYLGYLGVGSLVSTAANSVIKRMVKQERPVGSSKKGFGMPSDHSQMIWFLVSFFFLSLWHYHHQQQRRNSSNSSNSSNSAQRLGIVVPISRVVLGVHSVAQVVVGSLVGVAAGWLWFQLGVRAAIPALFPAIEASTGGKLLLLRHTLFVPGAITAQYHAALAARKQQKEARG
eukprot:CAMPEP_0175144952 /NCGR_PEP_ID=MMETSP0087-20121206/14464_1 /TAXON_ID=136419 /ORGANISM="Unknown Unknown, Strain D1" /LENGTH=216 /DNA_ID=CAMNT_0016429571 /DNA_START=80 /DNA_END=730 /DNA_ORIENTATION=+